MSIAFMHCVMLRTTVKIMQVQKLETQYNAKYTLHKKEASSKGHPRNKNDDAVQVVWCPIDEKHALHK